MIALTKLSETTTTITLGWTPVPGCIGYRFSSEKQAKPSHTWNASQSSIKFAKGSGWYTVEALGVEDVGEYPSASPPPPPPPPTGTSLQRFTDFKNNVWTDLFLQRWQVPPASNWTPLSYTGTPWSDGSGIFEITTPHGPGFRFKQGTAVPRSSGGGVQMTDIDHIVDQQNYLGVILDQRGKFMLPASGNPSGFPQYADWNALWEWSEDVNVFNQFGIDGYDNKLYVRTYDQASNWTRKVKSASPLALDRWYDWRWQIKWATNSSGFVNFWLDGTQLAAWTGSNLPAMHSAPHLQWGWYGGTQQALNEVQYAGLSYS